MKEGKLGKGKDFDFKAKAKIDATPIPAKCPIKGLNVKKKFNKKGQMLIVGIMIMVMALIIFIAMLPAIKSLMDNARSCESLNCAGYIDKDASAATCGSTNKTAVTTLQEDTLSCTILDLGIPYLILGVLVGLIAKLMHGKLVEPAQEAPAYYGGGY